MERTKPSKVKILTKCQICKAEFLAWPYSLRKNQAKFCGMKCYGKYREGLTPSPLQLESLKMGHGWNKGIKNPLGEKHHVWKGGITPFIIKTRRSFEYKLWRQQVFEKDNYICVLCGIRSGCGKKVILNADHYPKLFSQIIQEYEIKSYAEAVSCKELWDISNGRTLCRECHLRETSNYQKLNWKNQYANNQKTNTKL